MEKYFIPPNASKEKYNKKFTFRDGLCVEAKELLGKH